MAARSRTEEIEQRIKQIQEKKAELQWRIETRQENIARCQSDLLDPSTSEGRRAGLEESVQGWKGFIQEDNASIAQLNSEMVELVEERAAISGKASVAPSSPASETLRSPSDLLLQNEYLPGVILSQPLKKARVTRRGKKIYLEEEIGASLSIPRNSFAGEVEVGLAAGFSGSYELPDDMEPVSPAYVVTANRPVELSNDMTLRMQHTAVNTTDMALVEASLAPSQDRFVLRRSMKAIEHEDRFGVVKSKKLDSTVYRLVKPKDKYEGEEEKFYSARLYKGALGFKVKAVFCMCQDHPIYHTHCDDTIAKHYPDLFNKAEERTLYNALIITSESVEVVKSEATTWEVIMDKPMISRLEVDSPERYKVELSELRDYPPRIVLNLTPPDPTSPPADLIVKGLKELRYFTIPTPVKNLSCTPPPGPARHQKTMSVNIAELNDATDKFEALVFTKQNSPLVSCAMSMVDIMAEVKPLLYDPEHVNDLVKKMREIEGLIESIVMTEGAKNVQGSVAKVSMISHQFKKVAPAMLKCSGGDPEMWEGAVDVLVGNSVNLMHSIEELIRDAQVAAVESRARTKDEPSPGVPLLDSGRYQPLSGFAQMRSALLHQGHLQSSQLDRGGCDFQWPLHQPVHQAYLPTSQPAYQWQVPLPPFNRQPPSAEFMTVEHCTIQLETALSGLDRDLMHFLCQNGFIGDDVRDKVLNPVSVFSEAEKAGEVVRWIKNRIKQDPTSYHVLMGKLQQCGNRYQPIMNRLETTRQQLPQASQMSPHNRQGSHQGPASSRYGVGYPMPSSFPMPPRGYLAGLPDPLQTGYQMVPRGGKPGLQFPLQPQTPVGVHPPVHQEPQVLYSNRSAVHQGPQVSYSGHPPVNQGAQISYSGHPAVPQWTEMPSDRPPIQKRARISLSDHPPILQGLQISPPQSQVPPSGHPPGAQLHQVPPSGHSPGAQLHQVPLSGHPPGAQSHQVPPSDHSPGAQSHQVPPSGHPPGAQSHQVPPSGHQPGAQSHH